MLILLYQWFPTDIIQRWDELVVETLGHQSASHDLHGLYLELLGLEKSLQNMASQLALDVEQFDSLQHLQQTVNVIQVLIVSY